MSHRNLTLAEAADYLHLTLAEVEKLVRKQRIPFEKNRDRITIAKIALEQWASQRLLDTRHGDTSLGDDINKRARETHADAKTTPELMPIMLAPDRIEPQLGARTKSSVLSEMNMMADATGLVNNPVDLLESLRDREEICSTAITDGIALLHPRHHHEYLFEDSFIVLGRAIQPIPFGAPDGKLTDLFFLICSGDDRLHLRTLARLAVMCRKTDLITNLRAAETALEMYGHILAAEIEVRTATKRG